MKTFTEYLNEGRGFELGGKKYSSGFGRYTCNGESISKEEYMKASAQYKGGNSSQKSSNVNTNNNTAENDNYSKVSHYIDSKLKDMEEKLKQVSKYVPQTDRYYREMEVMKDSMLSLKDIVSDVQKFKNKGLSDRDIIKIIDGNDSKYLTDSLDYMLSSLLRSYENRFENALFYLK